MGHKTAEGGLSRNFNHLAARSPELLEWAVFLAVNLEDRDNYVPVGSYERDMQAGLNGEFKSDFKEPAEPALEDLLVEADSHEELADLTDFDALVKELLEEEAAGLGEEVLYA